MKELDPRTNQLSYDIIGAAIEVHKVCLLESIYEEALCIEFEERGIPSVERFDAVHTAQTMTYLRMTHTRLGLLINCNTHILKNSIKRIIL